MRWLFAALALAGALHVVCSPASAQGASARDVAHATRCPTPFSCAPGAQRSMRAELRDLIETAARNARVPLRVAVAVVKVESGFDPAARNGSSLGLTQIKCRTARGLGFRGACAELFDPATNLEWGLHHLQLALARGSVGYHQAGLHARRVSPAYVRKINAAMGSEGK